MKLQLIRNATLKIHYAEQVILVDPFFAPKHSLDPFVGKSKNPTADLPVSVDNILDGISLVIVSHLHVDHFDPIAQAAVPKQLPLICQAVDEHKIQAMGFEHVHPLDNQQTWHNLTITRTPAQHGSGKWIERMGSVMGFILQAEDEPTVYWAGDTIWYDAVAQVIENYQPDVIITHSPGAAFDESPIVMDAEQTIQVCQAAPQAKVIAVHMETLDHATVSRQDLRSVADAAGISPSQLIIPHDGETVSFE